jgi:hypothetical protein
VTYPHLLDWIESDLAGWLSDIRKDLADRTYVPEACATCYSPKPGWMVRPGAVLRLEDEVVLNAVVGYFYPRLWDALRWSQGGPDIAYQMSPNPDEPSWLKRGFPVWREWQEKSLAQLAEHGARFVLFADISAFYENVELAVLRSELNALGLEPELLALLMTCLNRWSQPRGKGIPQGYSASDILAKVYVNPVDQGLRNAGFVHLRYVDDVRVFCRSNLEAKRALLKLNELIRIRGLNLQTAKTYILQADEAKSEIDGVSPVIRSIQTQIAEELSIGPYASVFEIEALLSANPDSPTPEVLERAFAEGFSMASTQKFDSTLFHYLLTRLAKYGSRVAVSYCLDVLAQRPEETEFVLRYLGQVAVTPQEVGVVATYAASSDAIYDHQTYRIAKWFAERGDPPEELLRLCRQCVVDRNRALWLRAHALQILGIAGDRSDLDLIESLYADSGGQLERAEIVSALARMEPGRRNSFYRRIRGDGDLVRRAVEMVLGRLAGA